MSYDLHDLLPPDPDDHAHHDGLGPHPTPEQHEAARMARNRALLRRENEPVRPRVESGYGIVSACAIVCSLVVGLLAWFIREAVMHGR